MPEKQLRFHAEVNASAANLKLIHQIERHAAKLGAVSGPCINAYKTHFDSNEHAPSDLLSNLSYWLLSAKEPTRAIIEQEMKERHKDRPNKIGLAIVNSLRRTAGTNYQYLISYALARYLVRTSSAWYIQHPVPRDLQKTLAITFTGGVENTKEDGTPDSVEVHPDIDILLRNASWQDGLGDPEPVVMLSAKTSLADRAGMAARWKTYFDLVTKPCEYHHDPGCAYSRLGVSMVNASRYRIYHGLVTGNIYKIEFQDARYHKGELSSGQTRSNTYMFDLKFTTRDDGIAVTPNDWKQYPFLEQVLAGISELHNLPL